MSNRVTIEARRILLLCYDFRDGICNDRKKQEMLSNFIKYIEGNLPVFSAAGFFNIDKATIVNIFFTVVNFITLFIQLLGDGRSEENSQKLLT